VANIKSQVKRNRQSEVDRLRNRQVRSEINTRCKAALSAASEGADDAGEVLQSAISRIDKAAQKGNAPQAHRRSSQEPPHAPIRFSSRPGLNLSRPTLGSAILHSPASAGLLMFWRVR